MEELMAKYLADELDEKERVDFESKLVQDEDFSLEFEAYMNAWALHDNVEGGTFNTNAAWNAVQDQITETPVVGMKNTKFSLLKIAASLLVLAVAGYFLLQKSRIINLEEKAISEYVSPASGLEQFELPDGTQVKLNANSKLTYDKGFGEDHRNITLVGQGDFDVAHDASLPFTIKAGKGMIEVLGTSFDVAAYPDKKVKVVVTDGTVSFSSTVNSTQKAILKKGQQADLDEEGERIFVSDTNDDNFKGWWTRELNFEQDRFEDIFSVLESTYQIKIEYPEEIKDCQWTFQAGPNDTAKEVFDLFDQAFPDLQITQKENLIKLEGTVCDK